MRVRYPKDETLEGTDGDDATVRPTRPCNRVALVRMSGESRTREYVARQTAAGRTKKEIIRLLKRAIAREMFRCLTTAVAIPDIADLRPLRRSKNITLTVVAHHFGVWPAAISEIERAVRRDDDLAGAYRAWLNTASQPMSQDARPVPQCKQRNR